MESPKMKPRTEPTQTQQRLFDEMWGSLDGDCSDQYIVSRAILILAAEVRDLLEILEILESRLSSRD